MLSAAGFDSVWLERTVVSAWTVCCCLAASCSDEEQVTGDFVELCSQVDSVLGVVEVFSWMCFSGDWLAVSLESFAGQGGVGMGSEDVGCEARFCTAVSIAGDSGVLSGTRVPTVADWSGLCSGKMAGSLVVVC